MTGQVAHVDSLDDPRIASYRNLKDRELARAGDLFIAEGEFVVRRLLASEFPVASVLLAEHQVDAIAPLAALARPDTPIYVAPAALVSSIVGFGFHSGVIACGRRPAPRSLDEVVASWGAHRETGTSPITLVVLPEVTNTENMGSLLRIAAAFGATAVLLGPRCCDPFYRQSIRVSMGTIFRLRLIRSADLPADLHRLRSDWGVQLVAAVLDESAESLAHATRPDRLALLFGNEAQGLPADVVALCDRRITIPMKLGTDSLNVAVAAGIFLYHFTMQYPVTVVGGQ